MNWYKQASVNFSPKGWMHLDRNDTIHDLSWNVAHILWEKHKEIKTHDISPDGTSYDLGPTGVINFYLHNIPPEHIQEYIQDAKKALESLDVEVDPNIVVDDYQEHVTKSEIPDSDVVSFLKGKSLQAPRVARLNVIRNHNEEAKEMKKIFGQDPPPQINMAQANAHFIIIDTLGLPSLNEINVQELKDKLQLELSSYEPPETVLDEDGKPIRREEEYVHDIMKSLDELATWCIKRKYDTISVG